MNGRWYEILQPRSVDQTVFRSPDQNKAKLKRGKSNFPQPDVTKTWPGFKHIIKELEIFISIYENLYILVQTKYCTPIFIKFLLYLQRFNLNCIQDSMLI